MTKEAALKALTVYQPWASLECLGLKGTETRGHRTHYRGPLLIHAGRKWSPRQERIYYQLDSYLQATGWTRPGGGLGLPPLFQFPLGAALAVAELRDCFQVTEDNATTFTEFDRLSGDLSHGRWVWVLEQVQPLRHPVPCRGMQGIWTVPGRVEELIRRQERAGRRRDLARDAKLEADRRSR
jgi:activating signal cointegrator 1